VSAEVNKPGEKEPSLIDTIIWGTTLPEVHGELLVLRVLVTEMLATFDREQVERMLNLASERVDKLHHDTAERRKKNKETEEVYSRMEETGNNLVEKLRKRLLPSSEEDSSSHSEEGGKK
jgi:hypothetical protein